MIPTICLTQIFRQAKNSLITLNAHRIRAGNYPLLSIQAENNAKTLQDYLFIEEKNADNLVVHLRRLLTIDIPLRGYTAQDVMVLSPMHKGTAGTLCLNQFLQEYALPHEKPFLSLPGVAYKLHDRVMQIRNNYEKNVFNGDIGSISYVNIEDSSLSVSFYEKQVSYTFNEIEELTLAYATTIHKSQGSEFPIVIIPLFMQHFMMLKVKLLYTAVTRAQKLCVLIGEKRAIALALKNRADVNRMTMLAHFLQQDEA
jgi:exodeoxyribonuclease V alpha subunit